MASNGLSRPIIEANREFYKSLAWKRNKYRGLHVFKYETDLQIYREIIEATKPEVIVETGTANGGSAVWFAEFADVITIDKEPVSFLDPRITPIRGNSIDPMVIEQVYQLVDSRPCLVSLDSNHGCDHVRRELAAYAPLVPVDGYLVVEDTGVDAYGLESEFYPRGGPLMAVRQFLKQGSFQPNRHCERFGLGMNPGGWLKRIA